MKSDSVDFFFFLFFHPGPFYCCSRQQGIVLLLEAKCSFWEHNANSKHTRHDMLQANAGTLPSKGSHHGDHPLAGYGFARLPADPRCSTDLVSRCSSCSCEKSPSPYLYRLQSFQRTKMATSLHKINGVLFMGFSYSWEPDSAYKGLLIQLPGWFYTVNLSCFLCTV